MNPARFFRVVAVLALGPLATACAMNPFDGDPNGPPPAPQWTGAYGGQDDSIDDRDFADRRDRSDNPRIASRSDEIEPAPPIEPAPKPRRGDSDYGTHDVETAALPPPVDSAPPSASYREADLPPTDEPPPPSPRPSTGERTLTTSRHKTAEAEPPAPASQARAVTHTVARGEELSDIADQYDAREVDIIALNGLKPPYTLKDGQKIKVPVRENASAAPPKPGDYVEAGERAVVPSPKPDVAKGEPPARKSETASSEDGPAFDWPVSGKVIAGFGPGRDGLYNEGINIAVSTGTPVRASASGTVRYAGNELRGYGNLVLIEHAGGYVTAYAHNEVLTVKRGETVKRGDVIARSGQTGNVKSPQLHFEIRKGTQSLDPRKYLVAMN